MQTPKARAFTHVLAFCLGLLALFVIHEMISHKTPCQKKYDLLNPTLRCDDALQQGEWDYEPLRDALLVKINEFKTAGTISNLSVYFRDLDHGPRFGIGEYDKFHPASLRKVPIMIAYLHLADLDPDLLDQTLSFTGALKINANVEKSEQTIEPNTPYTIRELLRKMIVYSDNYSYTLLTNELNVTPPIVPYYTFRDLGVRRMMMDPGGNFISIDSYSGLFAVLYNTGYLSRDMSEYALELLSEVTFDDGLVAGVPKNTVVAHKFGERHEGSETELHDCGIVYHPAMAYVLCVMTTGTDFQAQKSAIAEMSGMVYGTVSSVSADTPAADQKEDAH